MKRVAAMIVVFMLLGALISVAFAWAWAGWAGVKEFDPQLTARLRRQEWKSHDEPDIGDGGGVWIQRAFADSGAEIVEFKVSAFGISPETEMIEHRFGWPWRCLRAREQQRYWGQIPTVMPMHGGMRLTKTVDCHIGLVAPGGMTTTYDRVLPWLPMWSGLFADTAVFGTFAFVLFAIPFAIRRLVRRLRRQCGHCGYPVGVSPVCTECGQAVRSRHVANPGKMEP